MKISLVFPAYSSTTKSGIPRLIQSLRGKYPPLGLAWVASSLEMEGHKVQIVDAEAEELGDDDVTARLRSQSPDIVGISSTIATFDKAKRTAQCIKKIWRDIPVILGGPQVTVFPELSLAFAEFDFGVVGEGEKTVCELVHCIENHLDLADVKGIVYRSNGKILKTPPRELIQDLDDIPLPAWHLLPVNRYRDMLTKRKGFATMFNTRGCPYNCLFCDPLGRLGRKVRARSPGNIVDEMMLLYRKYSVREICFYDDTFTTNKQHILALCDKIEREKVDVIWECRTRVNLVDKELLKKMAASGCYRIRYGVESGNPRILEVLRKQITKDQAREAFKLTKAVGMETLAYFMLGAPTETPETLNDTIDFALELDPSYVSFSVTVLDGPNSDLFKWAAKHGYIDEDYWGRFVKGEDLDQAPMLVTDILDKATVMEFYQRAFRKFYLRPGYIWKRFAQIRSMADLQTNTKIFLSLVARKFGT